MLPIATNPKKLELYPINICLAYTNKNRNFSNASYEYRIWKVKKATDSVAI